MMLKLTQRIEANSEVLTKFTLALTADERTRSRHRFSTEDGILSLCLPRGTVLKHGDLLQAEASSIVVQILAKPEPILTAIAQTPLLLLRAAYHLGNRHVPLEIDTTYLRLSPDPVLQSMLEHLGLEVFESVLPFQPEVGAYGHSHSH